jgi:hypothetical protein
MSSVLEQITAQSAVSASRLGAVQLNRLRQLARDSAELVLWDGAGEVTTPAALVVLEAPDAAGLRTLIGSLHDNAVVVLPYGENPAFDALKTRLYPYGSIGAQGTAAPHHLWWGGVKPQATRSGVYYKQDTLYISGFPEKWPHEDAAVLLAADLRRLDLNHTVEPHLPDIDPANQTAIKIDFIIRQRAGTNLPVFWLDPRSRVKCHCCRNRWGVTSRFIAERVARWTLARCILVKRNRRARYSTSGYDSPAAIPICQRHSCSTRPGP